MNGLYLSCSLMHKMAQSERDARKPLAMPFDSLIGKKLDDFMIEARLGQGAMAIVYKAYQASINRHVALKVIRLDEGQGQHEEFRKRFAREAEVIARLEHIHILPIYAYGIDEEMAYLAMRWLRGGSLSELLRREGVTIERAADIFKQIASGLSYAHSKGVIHRDLKPSNIMLDDAGNAYLTDFGLAKLAESTGEITKSGTIVGTPAYMSPEQLRGDPLDHRSDIYSLGVILYNMLAGRLPFDTTSSDLVSVIYQHLEKPPIPPSEFNPNIPPEVEAVILRALEKDRDARYNTADEMARALNLALGRPGSSDSISAIPVPRFGSQTRPVRSGKKRSPWYILSSLVVVLLVIGAAFLITQVSTNNALLATQTVMAETASALEVGVTETAVAAFTPTPLPVATVEVGKRAPVSSITPTQDEIARAVARLGANGQIAYVSCNQDSEFHAALAREMGDIAGRYGLNYRIYDAENDTYRQITLIERARSDGARAIIICPLDVNLLSGSLASIQSAGMPLVFFADNVPSYGGVLVGGDNYLLGLAPGRFAGQYISQELGGKANVVILDYPREDMISRANGLEDGLLEYAPDAHIVGRFRGATREFAKQSVSELIADGVEFDVIVSINDAGSFGAIEALEEAGIPPEDVFIASVDAEALAQQYIREDYYIHGSVQSSRDENAIALINAAVKLLAGSTIAELIQVPPGEMVTKETLLETTPEPA
jgi:serine/threonine protein kinase/ABC-type sugar transport system substrate-binding protein